MSERKAQIAKQFIQAIPHASALGMELTQIGDGNAEICMPYNEQLVGDPKTGVIHGGAVSALMDTCCGAAVMCHPDAPGGTATIDLRIDYLRPGIGEVFYASAEIIRSGNKVTVARMELHNQEGTHIAFGTGTYLVG